jgi:hypothetical protein
MFKKKKSKLDIYRYVFHNGLSIKHLDSSQKKLLKQILNFPDDIQEEGYKDILIKNVSKSIIDIKKQDDTRDHRPMRYIMYISPVVIAAVITLEFTWLYNMGVYSHTHTHHDIVLRVSSSLVGLLLASSSFLLSARNNDMLDELKHKRVWIVSEVSSFYGLLSFFLAAVVSYYNMTTSLTGVFLYKVEQIVFMTGLVYLFIEIISLRNALKYL